MHHYFERAPARVGRSARELVTDTVSRWLDWTQANHTIWLATIALLTTFHADIAKDWPRLR